MGSCGVEDFAGRGFSGHLFVQMTSGSFGSAFFASRETFQYTGAMATLSDAAIVLKQPAQVDHACGHRFTHMVPARQDGLLELLELLASHPCPMCASGLIDWSLVGRAEYQHDNDTGAC